MLVREAMSRTVVTVPVGATLKQAAVLLAEHSITSMPVVDDNGHVIGVLSEADVVRESLVPDQRAHLLAVPVTADHDATYVEQAMTAMPMTVSPQTDLAEAAQLMTDSSVKGLPVLDDGRLVGMVSRHDVVTMLARRDEQVEAEVDELVRSSGKDWLVSVVDGVVTLDGPAGDERSLARALVGTVRGVTGLRFREPPVTRRH
jgi:CBS domain-containing protein